MKIRPEAMITIILGRKIMLCHPRILTMENGNDQDLLLALRSLHRSLDPKENMSMNRITGTLALVVNKAELINSLRELKIIL